jgi:phosphopantothenoylcysteine decarboxylase/phosphopantothenate--cysteine ligase
MLKNREIILGVSGGIAAYKSVELLREMTKKGANVHVVMTKNAVRNSPHLSDPLGQPRAP